MEKEELNSDVQVSALVAIPVEEFTRLQKNVDNLMLVAFMLAVAVFLGTRMLGDLNIRVEKLEEILCTPLS